MESFPPCHSWLRFWPIASVTVCPNQSGLGRTRNNSRLGGGPSQPSKSVLNRFVVTRRQQDTLTPYPPKTPQTSQVPRARVEPYSLTHPVLPQDRAAARDKLHLLDAIGPTCAEPSEDGWTIPPLHQVTVQPWRGLALSLSE